MMSASAVLIHYEEAQISSVACTYVCVMRTFAASSQTTYLHEFLEVGGVQTLLELISVKQAMETDKMEAINVLCSVAASGREYKEHICECYGKYTVIAVVIAVMIDVAVVLRLHQLLYMIYFTFLD